MERLESTSITEDNIPTPRNGKYIHLISQFLWLWELSPYVEKKQIKSKMSMLLFLLETL